MQVGIKRQAKVPHVSKLLSAVVNLPKLDELQFLGAGDAGWDVAVSSGDKPLPMVSRMSRLTLSSLSRTDVAHVATSLVHMTGLRFLELSKSGRLVGMKVSLFSLLVRSTSAQKANTMINNGRK
jgi:hypothetical protein